MEPDFPKDVRDKLTALGHPIHPRRAMGATQLVLFDASDCYFRAGVDGRRDSGAAAVNLDNNTSLRAGCLLKSAGSP